MLRESIRATPAANFDIYIGAGAGTLNGVSGFTACWTFTDEGEPGANTDHLAIEIKDSGNNTVLNFTGAALSSGNHQAH